MTSPSRWGNGALSALTDMTFGNGSLVVVTIRVRRDPAFPGVDFISLRRYPLDVEGVPEDSAETASVGEALRVVGDWLRELPASPP